jgi:hypothetical protein
MTEPAPETNERETNRLWITDAEMIRRLGVPEKIAREALRMLDAQRCGFPRKEKFWGDRRYWPAVHRWFDERYGGPAPASVTPPYVPRHRPRPKLESAIAKLQAKPPNE